MLKLGFAVIFYRSELNDNDNLNDNLNDNDDLNDKTNESETQLITI
jgi:hypothetical protein